MKSLFVNYRTEIQENNSHLAFADSTKDAVRICEKLNGLQKENEQLKKELFETSKELLWATSDEVDRALHYEEEVEELRKEIFE